MKISIIVPAHNEQENISETIRKIEDCPGIEHELIVVNDHSSDATPGIVSDLIARYPNLRLVHNTAEAGFANAVRAGLAQIKTGAVVTVMADLCDDLNTLKDMLEKIQSGYDVVGGCRYIKGGARLGGSRLKGFLSSLGGRTINFLVGIPTHDIANAFKMYRKEVIDSIDIKSKAFEISMEMPLKAYYAGFKITEVPTVWRERTRGKSNFKILKLLPSYLKLYVWAIYKRLT